MADPWEHEAHIATPFLSAGHINTMIPALGAPVNRQHRRRRRAEDAKRWLYRCLIAMALAGQLAAATASELGNVSCAGETDNALRGTALLRLSFAVAATSWRFPDGKLIAALSTPQKYRSPLIARMPHYVTSTSIAVELLPAASAALLLTGIEDAPEVATTELVRQEVAKRKATKRTARNRRLTKRRFKTRRARRPARAHQRPNKRPAERQASLERWMVRALFPD